MTASSFTHDVTLAALHAAILAEPNVDLHRFAYADRLEELGDDRRSEFIRVQCDITRTPSVAPPECDGYYCDVDDGHVIHRDCRIARLEDRQQELIRDHGFGWCDGLIGPDWETTGESKVGVTVEVSYRRQTRIAGLAEGCGPFRFTFHRGFVHTVRCPLAAWMEYGGLLVRQQPVEKVEVSGAGLEIVEREPGFPCWRFHHDFVCRSLFAPPNWFSTDDAANDALSVAGIAWARHPDQNPDDPKRQATPGVTQQ